MSVFENQLFQQTSFHKFFYGFHIVSISVIENDEDLVDVCGLQTNKFHEIMQCEEWILIYLVFPKT